MKENERNYRKDCYFFSEQFIECRALETFYSKAKDCTKCPFHKTRKEFIEGLQKYGS
jgi:uracil-DNA glycosylase